MRTNFVQLIGFVGQEIKEITLSSGDKKIMLRVATSGSKKSKDGNITWFTTWHNVVAWDAVGEYATKNFVKGSRILVEGTIIYRTYPDQHGHIRYVAEIKANSLQNLDR
jgi:single-strand DNA-binding protein